jgi:hypothetical protein
VVESVMSMNDSATIGSALLAAAAALDDQSLLARVEGLARDSRAKTVEMLAHLGEIDRRKLHRGQGCGKLFGYCTEILRLSEAAAWNRIQAARAARRFPVILDLLADGRINLTTVRVLAPCLTSDNHLALLHEASGLRRRHVEEIVARVDPRAEVAASLRKLPSRPVMPPEGSQVLTVVDQPHEGVPASPPAPAPRDSPPVSPPTSPAMSGQGVALPRRGSVVPLRPSRYRLEVTIGEEPHGDLRWLQDAMRREIPDGDPSAIVGRALKALRATIEKKAFAATAIPRATHSRAGTPGSRHVPADVQRKVWERDGGRCAFVARTGRRCSERSYLEFRHVAPYARGGEATVANISLRCASHNAYEAEVVFGDGSQSPWGRARRAD